MNTSRRYAEKMHEACNLSFNSKKEIIKQTLTNEHMKQSERYLNRPSCLADDEVDDDDVGAITIADAATITRYITIDTTSTITEANTIAKDNTFTKDKTFTKAYTITEDDTINKDNAINKYDNDDLLTKTYTSFKYECKGCNEAFRNKTALTTHAYSHNRKFFEKNEYYDIISSQNLRELYFTDKAIKIFMILIRPLIIH